MEAAYIIEEMTLGELKNRLSFVENRLVHYRNLKALGYDRYEINPKLASLRSQKKNLKERIKELKTQKS